MLRSIEVAERGLVVWHLSVYVYIADEECDHLVRAGYSCAERS